MARTNLYKLYEDYITGYESVLDVGCGDFFDLVPFEEGLFKMLYGVDRKVKNDWYQTYCCARSKIDINATVLDFEEFLSRYKIEQADILQYDFGDHCHNFIICKNVLHFFPNNDKLLLIERMYKALYPRGILFIQLNHSENVNVTSLEAADQLDKHVYASKATPEQVFYLVEEDIFISEIMKQYTILNDKVERTDRWIRFAIKK
jgi:SAM-dependent methyltransferase